MINRPIYSVLLGAAFAVLPALCHAQGYLITTVAGGGVPFTPAPATSVPLGLTASVAVGAHGNVYFVASNFVFKMGAAGVLTRVAGTSSWGYSGDGGLAIDAQLNSAAGVAVDGSGNVFIADTDNNVIRKVAAATGIVTTVAGNGSAGYLGDGGPATRAVFNSPAGVAVDGFGNLYIADSGNDAIRKVAAATGIVTPVAGQFTKGFLGVGGPATNAELGYPSNLAVDGSSNLYIVDSYRYTIRKVTAATGIITTVAGNGTALYSGDGGPATSAGIGNPSGVAVDGSGNIYVGDNAHNVVREVTAATGIIATVAGNGSRGDSGDGGAAANAEMWNVSGVAVDGSGNLYIADSNNFAIRKVLASTGVIATVAGNRNLGHSGDGGPAINAQLEWPESATPDGSGNLYIADYNEVRKVVIATGIVTTVAGSGAAGYSGDGGPAINAALNGPFATAVDRSGNLYIADTGNNVVRKVTAATGIIATVAGNGSAGYSGDGGPAASAELNLPTGVAVDGSGNLYIADLQNNAVRKVAAATGIITTVAGLTTRTPIYSPSGVAVDAAGNLYIAGGNAVWKMAAATGVVATVAGNGAAGYAGDGGPAIGAELYIPAGVAVDGIGNLYIADLRNAVIRKVTAATGIIATIAGKCPYFGYSGDGGPATSAELNFPRNVAVDSSGNVYIADGGNFRIRLLVPAATHALLSVAKTHTGSFTLGQTGAAYSVVVSNAAKAGATSGTVTLSEIVPAGLTLQSMSGAGWSCAASANTCTRNDALSGGDSYPPVSVVVNVPADGPSQATNQVTLMGGGATPATGASDTANILANASAVPAAITVSAASGTAPVTADSIVSLYAVNIDTAVFTATAGPPAPLPTALGGVGATVTDSSGKTAPIPLIAVTPSQVNAVLPAGLQTGEATINVTSSSGARITGGIALVTVAPALFTADESGGGVAAAQVVIAHRDGSQTFSGAIASCNSGGCTPIPINLGSSTDQAVLELFGTGIRGAGGASNVTVSAGSTQGTVLYAGAQGGGLPGSYYGLDQVNVVLPRSLMGSGTVNIVLTAGGQTANTVKIDIQ